MTKFVYINSEGVVSIVTPAPKDQLEKVLGPLTVEQYKAHVLERSIPNGLSFIELSDNEIPENRTFRNAWKLNGNLIDHDLGKCRALIREKRNRNLLKLDDKALSESRKPNGSLVAVDSEAQRLRDIPQDVRFNSNNLNDLINLYNEADLQI